MRKKLVFSATFNTAINISMMFLRQSGPSRARATAGVVRQGARATAGARVTAGAVRQGARACVRGDHATGGPCDRGLVRQRGLCDSGAGAAVGTVRQQPCLVRVIRAAAGPVLQLYPGGCV